MGGADRRAGLDEGELIGMLRKVRQQVENHAPLSPYCFQVRLDTKSLPTPPCVLVLIPEGRKAAFLAQQA